MERPRREPAPGNGAARARRGAAVLAPALRCVLLVPGGGPALRTPLFGLLPVERTVLAFLRAGVREFVLAGDAVRATALSGVLRGGRCRDARVRVAPRRGPWLPDARFLVARADTHYDRRLVSRFVESAAAGCGPAAAVDLRPEALAAHDGAARVQLFGHETGEDGAAPAPTLRRVGRGLVGADGVLAGLLLGTQGLLRAGDAAEREPDEAAGADSLDTAVAALARREPVAVFPVAELWQEIANTEDVAIARRKVLAGAVGIADGVVARHLNRRISQRITARLLARDVKPWQMSLAVFGMSLAAGLAFAVGHAGTGGILAQCASVLDSVDGELARIRYQDSPFGGVYDALLDRIGDAVVIGGMTLYAWLAGSGHLVVALGFAAVAGSSLSMLVKEKYGTQFARPWADEREGAARWLLLGRDGRLFLALVAGVTGHVEAVLAYLAVGTHVHAGLRILRIREEALGS
jgi:CDP-L-myo-inositol myo-inositolphosphotransferase